MHCGRLFYVCVIEKISEISLHSLQNNKANFIYLARLSLSQFFIFCRPLVSWHSRRALGSARRSR